MNTHQPGDLHPGRESVPAALLRKLHAAAGSGLIAIEGPAGIGKIQLVEAFLSEYECDAVRVSLDESCAVPEILAERVLFGLAPSQLRSDALLSLADLQAQLRLSLESESRGRPLVLVLDGFEHLAGSTDTTDVVDRLVRKLAPYTNVIIIGRSIPSDALENTARAAGGLWLTASDFIGAGRARNLFQSGTAPLREASTHSRGLPESAGNTRIRVNTTDRVMRRLAEEVRETETPDERFGPVWRPTASPSRTGPSGPVVAFSGSVSTSKHEAAWRDCESLLHAGLGHHAAEVAIRSTDGATARRLLAWVAPQALREGVVAPVRRLAAVAGAVGSVDRSDPLGTAVLARVEAAVGDPSKALQLIATIEGETDLPIDTRVQALTGQLAAARALGGQEQGSAAAEELARLSDGPPTASTVEAALYAGDHSLYVSGNLKRARKLYERADKLSRSLGDQALTAQVEAKLGELALVTGDAERAVRVLRSSADKWSGSGRTARLAVVLNNLGMALSANGQVTAARLVLSEAVEAASAAGLDSQRAYALTSLAELECDFGSAERARARLNEALSLCSGELVEERLRALALADLANCEVRLGAFVEARQHAVRAALLAEETASPIDHAVCLRSLARVEAAAGDYDAAETTLSAARKVLEAAGATAEAIATRLQAASLYFERGSARKASGAVKRIARDARRDSARGSILAALRISPAFAAWVRERGLLGSLLTSDQWHIVEADVSFSDTDRMQQTPTVSYSQGSRRIERDGTAIEWPSSRARMVFEEFLTHRDGVTEEVLRTKLEPADPSHRGNSALQSALCQLERVLDQGSVQRVGESLRLDPALAVRVA